MSTHLDSLLSRDAVSNVYPQKTCIFEFRSGTPDQDHSVSAQLPGPSVAVSQEDQILAYARQHGSIGSSECQRLLNVDYRRAWYLLKRLTDSGRLTPTGKGKGRRYSPAET